MKRYLTYLMTVLLCLGSAGCNSGSEDDNSPETSKMTGVFSVEAVGIADVTEIFPGKTASVSVRACANAETGVSDRVVNISFAADETAVASYNSAHGTSYEMLPGSAFEFVTNEVMMPRFGTGSTTAKISLSTSGLVDGVTYLLPVTVSKVTGTDKWALAENPCAYIIVKMAYVAPDAGTGTKDDPYNIYNATDLTTMSAKLEEGVKTYFRLMADIDMKDIKWIPLNFATPYKLLIDFNGNGHTLDNFHCEFANYPSFFGVLYGDCYDLTFTNAVINCETAQACGVVGSYCGTTGLPGRCSNVHVVDCDVLCTANVRGVGGLFGRIVGSTVTDCSVSGKVNHAGGATGTGGLCGYAQEAVIERCSAECEVVSTANYTGGLTGYDNATSTIKDCWTGGSVTGPQRIGGIAGGLLHEKTSLINCYSTAELTATFCIGGIAGHCNLDKNSSVLPSDTQAEYVVEKCIAWNNFILATNQDDDPHYSSGAITGYTSQKSFLTSCYRKADLNFTECKSQSGNVLYDQPNATPSSPLVKAEGTMSFNYPYHGVAAAAGVTLSSLAKSIGWSEAVWDFSGSLPVLKAVSGGSGTADDEDAGSNGQLPDFDENELF